MELDVAGTGFLLTDPRLDDHPIVYVNEPFLEMTGYPADEVLGRNCRFLQGEGTDEAAIDELRRAIADERPATVELEPHAGPFAALDGPTGRHGVREVQAPPALVAGIGAARGPLKTRASIQHLHPEALRSKVHAHLHIAVVAPVFHRVGDQLRGQKPGVVELVRGQLGT